MKPVAAQYHVRADDYWVDVYVYAFVPVQPASAFGCHHSAVFAVFTRKGGNGMVQATSIENIRITASAEGRI